MIPRIHLYILNRTGSKASGARNQRRPSSDARGQESSLISIARAATPFITSLKRRRDRWPLIVGSPAALVTRRFPPAKANSRPNIFFAASGARIHARVQFGRCLDSDRETSSTFDENSTNRIAAPAGCRPPEARAPRRRGLVGSSICPGHNAKAHQGSLVPRPPVMLIPDRDGVVARRMLLVGGTRGPLSQPRCLASGPRRVWFLKKKAPAGRTCRSLELLALEGGRQTHLKQRQCSPSDTGPKSQTKAYAQREQNRTGNEGNGPPRRPGTDRRGSSP